MAKIKLTKSAIEKLHAPDPSGRQRLYWDEELTGFGVLCSGKTNAKTYVVQRDLPGGRTRRVTIGRTNVLDLDTARDRAKEKLATFYAGKDPKAGQRGDANATLQFVLDDFLASRPYLRPKSVRTYNHMIKLHLANWLDRPMRVITGDMVKVRHAEIKNAVEKRATKQERDAHSVKISGNSSANLAMTTLSTLWNHWATDIPDFPPNPVQKLKHSWYTVERRRRRVWTEDLPRFYAAFDKLSNTVARDYLKLLLFTGLRRGEASALRWDEVDLVESMINLPGSRTKNGKDFNLPMSDLVRNLLVARRALGEDGDFVFPSDGKYKHLIDPGSTMEEIADLTGIRISSHDLRRTFATIAEGCVSGIALKSLLNHTAGNDVTGGYVFLNSTALREAAQRVADRLKELCKIPAVTQANVAVLR